MQINIFHKMLSRRLDRPEEAKELIANTKKHKQRIEGEFAHVEKLLQATLNELATKGAKNDEH
jgi:hypothetical protein